MSTYKKWSLRYQAIKLPASYLPYLLGLYPLTPQRSTALLDRIKKTQQTHQNRNLRMVWGICGEDKAYTLLSNLLKYTIIRPPDPTESHKSDISYAGRPDGVILNAHGEKQLLWENKTREKSSSVEDIEIKDLVQIHAYMFYTDIKYTLYTQYHPDTTSAFLIEFSLSFWIAIQQECTSRITRIYNNDTLNIFDTLSNYSTLSSMVRSRRIFHIRHGILSLYYDVQESVSFDETVTVLPRIRDLTRSRYFVSRTETDLTRYRYNREDISAWKRLCQQVKKKKKKTKNKCLVQEMTALDNSKKTFDITKYRYNAPPRRRRTRIRSTPYVTPSPSTLSSKTNLIVSESSANTVQDENGSLFKSDTIIDSIIDGE